MIGTLRNVNTGVGGGGGHKFIHTFFGGGQHDLKLSAGGSDFEIDSYRKIAQPPQLKNNDRPLNCR